MPILDNTLYSVIGVTAAVSWELPHNPFYYDDEYADAFTNGNPVHRIDVDVNEDSYYFGQNNNLLQDNIESNDVEYYNINKSETYEWNKLM